MVQSVFNDTRGGVGGTGVFSSFIEHSLNQRASNTPVAARRLVCFAGRRLEHISPAYKDEKFKCLEISILE